MNLRLIARFFCVVVIAITLQPSMARAVDMFVTLGTAGITGVYYPTGGAICRFVNVGRKEHNIRCSVESTGGSIENLQRLRANDLDFAIVQSDWQFHAVQGDGIFADQGPNNRLRSVFSLHSEAFTVLVRKDSGIDSFDALKGTRINAGPAGSGTYGTLQEVIKNKGWKDSDFKEITTFRPLQQAEALCSRKTDALLFSGGNPNGTIQEVTTTCPVKLLSIEGAAVEALVKDSPFYSYATIPGGMYPGNPEPVRTFGVKATLVTSDIVSDEIVYQFVKSVFDNFSNFKTLHPVFSGLEIKDMVAMGSTAPVHPGALRYFREKGWVEPAITP